MLDRMVQGAVPRKHHIAFRDADGRLLHEEAFTRAGFDGPYTLVLPPAPPARDARRRGRATAGRLPQPAPPRGLAEAPLPDAGSAGRRPARPSSARVPLLFNDDVTIGLAAARPRRTRSTSRTATATTSSSCSRGAASSARRSAISASRGTTTSTSRRASSTASCRIRARSAGSRSSSRAAFTFRRSGGTRPGSSAWTRPTRTATSAASSGRGRWTRGSASSS